MVKHYLRVDLPDSIYLLDGFCMRQKKKDMYVDFAQPDGLKLPIVLPSHADGTESDICWQRAR